MRGRLTCRAFFMRVHASGFDVFLQDEIYMDRGMPGHWRRRL